MIYRIRKGPKYKPKLVHQDKLASYKSEIKIEIVFSGVRVTRSSVFRSLSVFFLLVTVLSVLRYTDSDYSFGIFKLFLRQI